MISVYAVRSEAMLSSCHQLVLDRLSLTSISLLDSPTFSHVTHIYLQHNLIADIAPLVHLVSPNAHHLTHSSPTPSPPVTHTRCCTFVLCWFGRTQHWLRFVSLASNEIGSVPDLTGLDSLRFIDLSDNRIDDFEPELLPFELQALHMRNNPCAAHPAYQHHLLAALPYLTVSANTLPRLLPQCATQAHH